MKTNCSPAYRILLAALKDQRPLSTLHPPFLTSLPCLMIPKFCDNPQSSNNVSSSIYLHPILLFVVLAFAGLSYVLEQQPER